MKKGEPARDQVRRKILYLASDDKEHSISDFLKDCRCAKNTVYKYVRELVDDGCLEAKLPPIREGFKPRFVITSKGIQEVCRMDLKEILSSYTEKASPQELKKVKLFLEERLRELPDEIEKENKKGLRKHG
jgi:hypothetical protein